MTEDKTEQQRETEREQRITRLEEKCKSLEEDVQRFRVALNNHHHPKENEGMRFDFV